MLEPSAAVTMAPSARPPASSRCTTRSRHGSNGWPQTRSSRSHSAGARARKRSYRGPRGADRSSSNPPMGRRPRFGHPSSSGSGGSTSSGSGVVAGSGSVTGVSARSSSASSGRSAIGPVIGAWTSEPGSQNVPPPPGAVPSAGPPADPSPAGWPAGPWPRGVDPVRAGAARVGSGAAVGGVAGPRGQAVGGATVVGARSAVGSGCTGGSSPRLSRPALGLPVCTASRRRRWAASFGPGSRSWAHTARARTDTATPLATRASRRPESGRRSEPVAVSGGFNGTGTALRSRAWRWR